MAFTKKTPKKKAAKKSATKKTARASSAKKSLKKTKKSPARKKPKTKVTLKKTVKKTAKKAKKTSAAKKTPSSSKKTASRKTSSPTSFAKPPNSTAKNPAPPTRSASSPPPSASAGRQPRPAPQHTPAPQRPAAAPKIGDDPQAVTCPDCGSANLITDYKHGEIICKDCGLVLEESLFDTGPEWRAFDEVQKSKRARTGGPVKFAKLNKGLTTEIDRYDRDIRGGAIQPERKAQLYRLRKWQRRSRMSDSVQRNLSIALPELDRMCAYLNIPNNIKEECAMWYRKAVNKGLVRGRSIESVVAAIIYLISRKHQLPKTLEELEEASGVKKKDIGRSYRFACRRLGLRMPVATPMDYVPRFASELELSGETEALAIDILERARKKGVTSGRGPTGVAAAAIYLAAKLTNDRQTQKGIAGRLAGVTEVTIRNRYEEIARELDIEI